jgi:hypothetical protein
MRPQRARAASIAAASVSSLVTSAAKGTHSPPCVAIAAVSSAEAIIRSTARILAPSVVPPAQAEPDRRNGACGNDLAPIVSRGWRNKLGSPKPIAAATAASSRVSSRHSSFLARRHLGVSIYPPQGEHLRI